MSKKQPHDGLTDEEIGRLRGALETLRVQLRADLSTNVAETEVVDLDQPIGRLSRMDAIQQQKMAQATKARVRLRLQLVDAALARIERDDG